MNTNVIVVVMFLWHCLQLLQTAGSRWTNILTIVSSYKGTNKQNTKVFIQMKKWLMNLRTYISSVKLLSRQKSNFKTTNCMNFISLFSFCSCLFLILWLLQPTKFAWWMDGHSCPCPWLRCCCLLKSSCLGFYPRCPPPPPTNAVLSSGRMTNANPDPVLLLFLLLHPGKTRNYLLIFN